jgi:transposase
MKNRLAKIEYDRHLYKERNVVERFFARVKQFWRVATRYDKLARNYLGFDWVASIRILLA